MTRELWIGLCLSVLLHLFFFGSSSVFDQSVMHGRRALHMQIESVNLSSPIQKGQKKSKKKNALATKQDRSDQKKEKQTGAAAATRAEGDPKLRQSYASQVAQWLARFRHYPANARRLGMTGRAIVALGLDRFGSVTSFHLQKSTGSSLLDDEVYAMVKRAGQFPRAPENLPDQHFHFQVPVQFSLD